MVSSMMPPAMPKEDSEIYKKARIYLPENIKTNNTSSAINNSLIIIIQRRSGAMFFKILRKRGIFPIESIMMNNKTNTDKTIA